LEKRTNETRAGSSVAGARAGRELWLGLEREKRTATSDERRATGAAVDGARAGPTPTPTPTPRQVD